MIFISPSKGKMEFEEVVMDILAYIAEDRSRTYRLTVGSDSHYREREICFVSAIIIHRLGKGARYFYKKTINKTPQSLQQRIFYEASLSLNLADRIENRLKQNGQGDMKVEIHLDIGTNGETKELVKVVTGMIIGSGFDAKIKPDASAASTVADRYTK